METSKKEIERTRLDSLGQESTGLESDDFIECSDRQARIDRARKSLQHTITCEPGGNRTKKDSNNSFSVNVSLEDLQFRFQQLVDDASDYKQLGLSLLEITSHLTNSIWCGILRSEETGQLTTTVSHSGIEDQNLGIHRSSLLPVAAKALRDARAQIQTDTALTIVCVPVFGGGKDPAETIETVCLALNLEDQLPQPFLLITQLVAATLGQWHFKNRSVNLEWEIDSSAAITELMSQIIRAESPPRAAVVASNELARFLDAELVAFGFCTKPNGRKIKLESVSGIAQIDRGSQQGRLVKSALEEALTRKEVSTIPELPGDDRSLKMSHKKLLDLYPDCRIVSSTLLSSYGESIGAWLSIVPNDQRYHEEVRFFHQATTEPLADAFIANQKANDGVLSRLKSSIFSLVGGKTGRLVLLAIILVGMILCIPIQHRVSCPCSLEPAERRFAVAPHDGVLLESRVRPGDLVSAGQVIAIMDDRELNLQLLDLEAQRETAMRNRDVNRSGRDAAAIQLSELEVKQLDAKIELIKYKRDNLEIKSAVDGVVLSGELDDAEGASVRRGDVLMEIASLENLRLEVNIAESDIAYVDSGSQVLFVLEGSPLESLTGKLERIRPKTELREDQNVFVSETQVANSNNALRPGMQGMARIDAGTKSLGWVLFHKPVERIHRLFR